VARPEARRAFESLVPLAEIPTPIANAQRGCDFFESEESTHHTPRDVASKNQRFLNYGNHTECDWYYKITASKRRAPTPELRNLVFDTLSFPKIDGSTSTQPLITCRYFDLDFRWTKDLKWTSEPSSSFMDLDIELKLAEYSLTPLEKIETQRRLAGIVGKFLAGNESTHRAYRNILEGKSGFGLLARKPNADEIELGPCRRKPQHQNLSVSQTPETPEARNSCLNW